MSIPRLKNIHRGLLFRIVKKNLVTVQISINYWNRKQNALCLYNGMLFSGNNEQATETCYDIDRTQKHYKILK